MIYGRRDLETQLETIIADGIEAGEANSVKKRIGFFIESVGN